MLLVGVTRILFLYAVSGRKGYRSHPFREDMDEARRPLEGNVCHDSGLLHETCTYTILHFHPSSLMPEEERGQLWAD